MFSELIYVTFIFAVGFFLGCITVGPSAIRKEYEIRNKMRREDLRRKFEKEMSELGLYD